MTRLKRQIAHFTQWLLLWADPSLCAAPLLFERDIARMDTAKAMRDRHQAEHELAQLSIAVAYQRVARAGAEELAEQRHIELDALRARNLREAEAAMLDALAATQATDQRAKDDAVYADYLYDVMRQACRLCGLDPGRVSVDFDLSATGKLNDVLYHMATLNLVAHPLRTAGDVVAFLVRA